MNDILFAGQHLETPLTRLHQHDFWELLYCVEDMGSFSLAGLEVHGHAGDVLIIPPHTEHAHCVFCGGCIYLYVAEASLALQSPLVLQDDGNQSLQHLFADTYYLFHSALPHRDALLPAYGQLIAQHVSARKAVSPQTLLVEEIAQSILQNYTSPTYELDALLKSAPYCYDYLCRLFRQSMHTTPHKYLMNLRLEASAELLRMGDGRSITEIARMCGYHDPLYFSRMFKKKYGVSPREYGKNMK